jgi:hypothetical protein
MQNNRALVIVLAAASAMAGCAELTPSERASSPTSSLGLEVPPTESAAPVPESSASTPPTTSPSTPSPSPAPPYRIILGGNPVHQEPGTILFGSLPGPISDALLEPFPAWPERGLTIEAEVAFGAFWGGPLGASQITITLYRIEDGVLNLVWRDTKRVGTEETGYLDALVPFRRAGTYRLEVTRGATLLAWGVAFMGPPCGETDCSGG